MIVDVFEMESKKAVILYLSTVIPALLLFVVIDYTVHTDSKYKAAIVEFRPDHYNIQRNLDGLKEVLENITKSDNSVAIVVFPEDAIVGFEGSTRETLLRDYEEIPDPLKKVNPCTNSKSSSQTLILKTLSCFARDFQVVLVANMGEREKCTTSTSCNSDGYYLYNTNVVFEIDGHLIAKYRKTHLVTEEKAKINASIPSCVTFNTSFGVTFGTLTCFELLYKNLGNCLINERSIRNIVFTTAWGNNFPFYLSIAFQQSWSMKHKVNLLAANQQYVSASYHSSGSGIYSAGYPKAYYISGVERGLPFATGKFIIAELPKNPSSSQSVGYPEIIDKTHICTSSSKYLKYERLVSKEGRVSINTSSNNTTEPQSIICDLDYSMKKDKGEYYALGAYIGLKLDDESFGYAACSLVKCKEDKQQYKCGYMVYKSGTILFEKLQLTAVISGNVDLYATALGSGFQLLNPRMLKIEGNSLSVNYDQPLLSASLWTRVDVKRK